VNEGKYVLTLHWLGGKARSDGCLTPKKLCCNMNDLY